MLDEIRQIAIFAKTINHGSFRAAAKALQLSPSVVSHHISQLEEKLGVALIYRSTRRLTLTREGEKLLASAQTMLAAVEEGLNDIRDQSDEPSGEIRVSMPSILSRSQLIPKIADFKKSYPKIKIALDLSDEKRNLIKDGYDLAIRMSPQRQRAQNRKSLFSVRRCIVASKSYLASCSAIETPHDLNHCDWIELTPAANIQRILHNKNQDSVKISGKSTLSANNAHAVYHLAKAGVGIALVPDLLTTDDIAAGKICLALPDWEPDPLDTFAEWPPNAPKNGIIRLLVNALAS